MQRAEVLTRPQRLVGGFGREPCLVGVHADVGVQPVVVACNAFEVKLDELGGAQAAPAQLGGELVHGSEGVGGGRRHHGLLAAAVANVCPSATGTGGGSRGVQAHEVETVSGQRDADVGARAPAQRLGERV